MANVKQCDECGKIIDEGEVVPRDFLETTKLMSVGSVLTDIDKDYCLRCAHKAAAEAGQKLWERYKRPVVKEAPAKKKEAKDV